MADIEFIKIDERIRVKYRGGLNKTIDKILEACFEFFEYENYGSGCDLRSGIRDISFRKKESEKAKDLQVQEANK